MKKIFFIFLIFSLAFTLNTVALAEGRFSRPPSPGAVLADILAIRPIGFVGTVLGTAACIVSLPVTIPFNSTHEVAKVLVFEPYRYTFERPLGEMEFHGVK